MGAASNLPPRSLYASPDQQPGPGARPSWGVCRVGTITGARPRAHLVEALVLVGLVACGNTVFRADDRPNPFERLSRHAHAAQPRPVAAAGLLTASAAAADTDARLADGAAFDGSAFFAAHGFAEPPEPPAAATRPPLAIPKSPSEWFNPRGRNEGTEGIVADLAALGIADNHPLYVNECWGRTWGAATSDHHTSQVRSWACDLSVAGVHVPTPQAHEAARRIGSALGEPGWTGGNLKKVVGGYRVQVLWMVAGHYDHVHIGVRKL
jgi:hypothetical protein